MGTSRVHLAICPSLTFILISPRKRERQAGRQSKPAAPTAAPGGLHLDTRCQHAERPWAAPAREEAAATTTAPIRTPGGSHQRGGDDGDRS